MDHSLINPNQIKITVMQVFDDLFDNNRKLGISHKQVFITFITDRTIVFFDSRVPTQREITECTQIIMMG